MLWLLRLPEGRPSPSAAPTRDAGGLLAVGRAGIGLVAGMFQQHCLCLSLLRHLLGLSGLTASPLPPPDYLLSNNYVNSIIVHKFDFSDEEIMAYYISFLKTLSLKLNKHTVHFFYNEVSGEPPAGTATRRLPQLRTPRAPTPLPFRAPCESWEDFFPAQDPLMSPHPHR